MNALFIGHSTSRCGQKESLDQWNLNLTVSTDPLGNLLKGRVWCSKGRA